MLVPMCNEGLGCLQFEVIVLAGVVEQSTQGQGRKLLTSAAQ